MSRCTSSVRSVGTLAAFFGHAIQSPPSTSSTSSSLGMRPSSWARSVWKLTIVSNVPRAAVETCTPSGRSSSDENPSGAPRMPTRWPALIPSFCASGVPE